MKLTPPRWATPTSLPFFGLEGKRVHIEWWPDVPEYWQDDPGEDHTDVGGVAGTSMIGGRVLCLGYIYAQYGDAMDSPNDCQQDLPPRGLFVLDDEHQVHAFSVDHIKGLWVRDDVTGEWSGWGVLTMTFDQIEDWMARFPDKPDDWEPSQPH